MTTSKSGLAEFGGEGGARIVGGPRPSQREADERGRAEAGERQPQRRTGEVGRRREGEGAHDEEGRQAADFQDDEFAPAVAPGGERDGGGEAERDRCAWRGEAEQGPEDEERRQTEMDDEEGLHGVLHKRNEGIVSAMFTM